MEKEIKLIKNPEALFRQTDDEGFLFNPNDATLITINKPGIFIWNLLDGKHTNKDIAEAIFRKYKGSTLRNIKDDLDKFVSKLKKAGFIDKITR